MRLMSFALTTAQILDRSKTVTRRMGWKNLKPGDQIRAVKKAMGFKKGEKVGPPLAVIEVVSVRREPLDAMLDDPKYGHDEFLAEGFTFDDRVDTYAQLCVWCAWFAESHGCDVSDEVTRIEFRYVDEAIK